MAAKKPKPLVARIKLWSQNKYRSLQKRYQSYLKRRPHRSFQRTRRRDLPGRANLPSNIMFTVHVVSFIRQNKAIFLTLTALYVVLYILIAGIASQENYAVLADSLRNLGSYVVGEDLSKPSETVILLAAAMTGGLDVVLSEAQQLLVGFVLLFLWMVIVWICRHRFNQININLRDALYNAGTPSLPTLLVALIGVLQAIPAAIGVLVYTTLQSTSMLDNGAVAMLVGIGCFLLVLMSAYWLTSTFIALVVVTVPGTYPLQAIKVAGDIAVGRRLQVLLRLLWLVLLVIALWIVVLVPVVLIGDALPWDWLPLVPITTQLLNAATFVLASVYIYILYRGMIDEPIVTKE